MNHTCLREYTFSESQITPAVIPMNMHKYPKISQHLCEIPASVGRHLQLHPMFSQVLARISKHIEITPMLPLYSGSNSSKSAVRFRVRVGTELEPLQLVLPYPSTKLLRTRALLAGSTILPTLNIGSN